MGITRSLGEILFAEYVCEGGIELIFKSVSEELAAYLGYDRPSEIFGSVWDYIHPGELEKRKRSFIRMLDDGDEIELLLPFVRKDGSGTWLLTRAYRRGDEIRGIFVPLNRIKSTYDRKSDQVTEYKKQLEETKDMVNSLRLRATQDSLTKLNNADASRRYCMEYLEESSSTCALLVIDLDKFKIINDSFGHMMGDRVLVSVATELRNLFRRGDIVGRIGGDEFLVMMKDLSSTDIVQRKCESIVSQISALQLPGIPGGMISCSVGAAIRRDGEIDYDAIFCRADDLMYSTKSNGGNAFLVTE